MQLSIKHDMDQLQKELNSLGKKAIKPALNAALNREGEWAKNESIREVARVQRVKQVLLKEKATVRRSNFRTLTYSVEMDVRGITWGRLNPRVRKRRGGVTVGGGKHGHRHAFLRVVGGPGGKNRRHTNQVLVRRISHHSYDGRYPLGVLRVRLRKPFDIAFSARSKEARARLLKQVERELEFRVKREVERAK